MLNRFRCCLPFYLMIVAVLCSRGPSAEARGDDRIDFFETRIRPLLVEHCVECHGAKKQEGGLRLDARTGWEVGGDQVQSLFPAIRAQVDC